MGEPHAVGAVRSQEANVVDRGRRLFEFLAEAQRLRLTPVRTFDAYERDGAVYWLGDMPSHPAIFSATSVEELAADEPCLVVHRVAAVDGPVPGPGLEPWLDGDLGDPEQTPMLRDSIRDMVTGAGADVFAEPPVIWAIDRPEVSKEYERWRDRWDDWARKELSDRPVRDLYKSQESVLDLYVSDQSNRRA